MKHIFDFLRKISGGKLTQKKVDATNQVIATATDSTVADMLGIAIDQMVVSILVLISSVALRASGLLPTTMGWECGLLVLVPQFTQMESKLKKVILVRLTKPNYIWLTI
jgi:hypothetical protein